MPPRTLRQKPDTSPEARGADKLLRAVPVIFLTLTVAALQPADSGGWSLVLLAFGLGTAIAATVHKLLFALVASTVLGCLLLSTAYLQELQRSDGAHHGIEPALLARLHHHHRTHGPASGHAPKPEAKVEEKPEAKVEAKVEAKPEAGLLEAQSESDRRNDAAKKVASFRWRPVPPKIEAPVALESFSVVLPCAFEGEFAEKTVWAVWNNSDPARIKEILVIDDGSQPPLVDLFSTKVLEGGPGIPPARIIRHERTEGLISAKKTGGDAAKGDVIVFFDCHVRPRVGWEEKFLKQMRRSNDHRTVVVPAITSLDPDTFEEIPNSGAGKGCYVLLSADFTWLSSNSRDVPVMSGGLLALSRKWWEETGGYDDKMVAWGGENIDQSIRTWLCGGRIEVAEDAYVAHMWRDHKNPKTMLRYPIPTKDVMRNKARAATAWFDAFIEKTMTFPEYEQFTVRHESLLDMSSFEKLKKKLQCAPFTSYVQKFHYVYLDSGLIPDKVFQLRELSTGRCLQRKILDGGPPHGVYLEPCSGGKDGGPAADLQKWHWANRDTSRPGKPCCSGLMHWNFLQCLDATAVSQGVSTFECQILGNVANQFFGLDEESGNFYWRPSKKVASWNPLAPKKKTWWRGLRGSSHSSGRKSEDFGARRLHSETRSCGRRRAAPSDK